MFKWLFKNFKKDKAIELETSEHAQKERSVIRENTFEDDWMLNIEPVLEGDVEANEEVQKFIEQNNGSVSGETTPTVETSKPKVEGPLSSIISGAKKSNEANVAEIIEGSDTHRKMALIEKYRREGGEAPDDLYTDVSKSTFGSEYKNRANNISSSYKPMSIEEQLENRRMLSEQKINSKKIVVPQQEVKDDIATQIQKRKELSQRMMEERTPAKEESIDNGTTKEKDKETIE